MSGHSPRLARMLDALAARRNPLLAEFRRTWDHSRAGLTRFRESLPDRPEPTSIRDEADDFLDDLERAMRADS